jgi:hypothetical protein
MIGKARIRYAQRMMGMMKTACWLLGLTGLQSPEGDRLVRCFRCLEEIQQVHRHPRPSLRQPGQTSRAPLSSSLHRAALSLSTLASVPPSSRPPARTRLSRLSQTRPVRDPHGQTRTPPRGHLILS